MKPILIFLAALFGLLSFNLVAQPAELPNKEKMKIFSAWVGRWQGTGQTQMGPGEPKKSTVDERIESKLDGTILVVEGIGKATDPATGQETVVHHAYAVLSYDAASDQYKFRTYLKDGRSSDAWIAPTGENKFQWGFDITAGGKIRYSITLDTVQKTWAETGEYSRDGLAWSEFFRMNLKKVE